MLRSQQENSDKQRNDIFKTYILRVAEERLTFGKIDVAEILQPVFKLKMTIITQNNYSEKANDYR